LKENLQAPMDAAREATTGGELAMEKTMMEAAMVPPAVGIPPDVFWSVVFALSVIIAGLIIERVLKAYKH